MFRSALRLSLTLPILVATALTACTRQADTPAPPADTKASAPAARTPPAPSAQSENVKPFKIGDLDAMALRDGALEFPNDNQVFGVGHTPEEVASLLSAAGVPTDKLRVSLQPLLVRTPERVLLFDTGAGTNFGPSAGKLLTSLADAGVDPKSVTDIFISHVHGDHVGGLVNGAGELVFPAAAIHISATEFSFLTDMDDDTAKSAGISQHALFVNTITPKVATFAVDSEIIPGLVKAVDIAGHTPGHSGYLISSGQSSLFYVGDAMHHSVISVQKPEWPNGFDGDQKTAAESRSALLADSAASGQRLYVVHFPFPGIGKIEQRNGSFVWVPE
jgi:glyoxylase-like metal-dependent hydrolase (beta-lactamase superfamily II)